MRTSSWSTSVEVFCPWLTLARTPTEANSSLPRWRRLISMASVSEDEDLRAVESNLDRFTDERSNVWKLNLYSFMIIPYDRLLLWPLATNCHQVDMWFLAQCWRAWSLYDKLKHRTEHRQRRREIHDCPCVLSCFIIDFGNINLIFAPQECKIEDSGELPLEKPYKDTVLKPQPFACGFFFFRQL